MDRQPVGQCRLFFITNVHAVGRSTKLAAAINPFTLSPFPNDLMGVHLLERALRRLFVSHGQLLLAKPWPFLVLPVLLSALLSLGLLGFPAAMMKDELALYTPTNAQAQRELAGLDRLFHINDTDPFYASRRYDLRRTGYIVITAGHQQEDILHPRTLKAAAQLWSLVQSLAVDPQNREENGPPVAYPSLCVHFPVPESLLSMLGAERKSIENGQFCVSNPLLELFKFALDQSSTDQLVQSLSGFNGTATTLLEDKSAIGQLLDQFSLDQLGTSVRGLLGGVNLEPETRRIAGAKALMLPYALRHATAEEDALAEKWELKLADFLLTFNSPLIQANWWTYETLAVESARDREQLMSMLLPSFLAMSLFSILLCCARSPVHSRPLLALAGVLSVAMAIASALGLLCMLGFHFNSVVLSMPFIVFSVGIDNCFILLAAWRAAPASLNLKQRMGQTFGNAGVSITITWLTDLLSFIVGCFTPFPSVQMFCLASVVALLFTFAYQLTFFGALFGLTSRREMDNRHCLTMRRRFLKPSKEPTIEEHNLALSQFFRGPYASFILNKFVRAIIIVLFGVYLVISAYGCLNIKMGLEPYDLLPENSYGKRAIRIAEKYFPDYGGHLHVWMHNLSHIQLGHRRLWLVLDKEVELYEHTEFTGTADSWLRTFLKFQRMQGIFTTNKNFVGRLKQFLNLSNYLKYQRDVRFTEDGEMLEASRVTVRLRSIGFQNQSRAMHLFRRLAEGSELPTSVYADFFMFAEQSATLVPATISSIAVAGLAVVLVSLLFIPESLAALWVSFSIVSINLGILGLMPFCSIRLDFVSMVTIVMSIGFCVDFCAHLAHSFARNEGSSIQRIRNSLYVVGTPIMQSASSTVLGISFLATTESYIFLCFFKTILLVILLGVLHGLVILPVLLTIFHWDEKHLLNEDKLKNDQS